MPSAAALRLEIETALQTRIPGALTPRPRILCDLAATGIPELDALLEGGLPIGAITELVGPQSSGRTTLALASLAELTQAGKTVAWVDTSDTLDPESAAAAGINLDLQLWVRCGQDPAAASAALSSLPAQQHSGRSAFLAESNRTPAPSGGCGSPHPRAEARGMSQAVDALLQPDISARTFTPGHHYNISRKDRTVGTPGAPNRKLLNQKPIDRTPQDPRPIPRRAKGFAADREEQIPTDRLREMEAQGQGPRMPQVSLPISGFPKVSAPPLRFDKPQNHQPEPRSSSRASLAGDPPTKAKSPFWTALDQALRATDLLLAAGGFSAIVLDLASIPAEFAWRIPLATWFRFRAAADRARTVLLVLTQHPCARSSAELILRLTPAEPQSAITVLTGARFRVTLDRRRFESYPRPNPAQEPTQPGKLHLVSPRKPPQREANWNHNTAWAANRTGSANRGTP